MFLPRCFQSRLLQICCMLERVKQYNHAIFGNIELHLHNGNYRPFNPFHDRLRNTPFPSSLCFQNSSAAKAANVVCILERLKKNPSFFVDFALLS